MVSTRGAAAPDSNGATTSANARLHFKDKLTGSSDVLQKKLKALYEELSLLEQGSVDINSLNGVRKELISSSILLHKDKGVKAHAACCMADLLRLYAPDAPYTAGELRDMFSFFFQQLSNNLKSDSTYYHQYFLLLESLSTVKSIVLVCDLPNSDELISMLFREFFKLVKINTLGRNIEIYMADILVAVIDEAHTIPSDALHTIINQFRPQAGAAPHRMAAQVCTAAADKLQRHVCQYFTDIMLASTGSHLDDDNDDDDTTNAPSSEDVHVAHEIIHSMAISAPDLLHNVIPQLEAELRAEEVPLRCLATITLGKIFSNKKTGIDLVRKYNTCWKSWLQRKNDRHPSCRIAWIQSVKDFMESPQELKAEIERALLLLCFTYKANLSSVGIGGKIMDPDEKVRAATCKLFGEMPYETLSHHVSMHLLRAIGERILDKKVSITA